MVYYVDSILYISLSQVPFSKYICPSGVSTRIQLTTVEKAMECMLDHLKQHEWSDMKKELKRNS